MALSQATIMDVNDHQTMDGHSQTQWEPMRSDHSRNPASSHSPTDQTTQLPRWEGITQGDSHPFKVQHQSNNKTDGKDECGNKMADKHEQETNPTHTGPRLRFNINKLKGKHNTNSNLIQKHSTKI